jgi:cytochrome d ubiquinol oxidase subunit II
MMTESAFAFRHVVPGAGQRVFGTAFAASSILTPLFMGSVAGAIASGRVPPGLAAGNLVTSWLNPTSILAGILAVGTCAYLAAAYLCHDAVRSGEPDLAEAFRRRTLITAAVVGAVVLAGIAVLHADAPHLFHGLTHRALPLVLVSALAGIASFVLLLTRILDTDDVAGLAFDVQLPLWLTGPVGTLQLVGEVGVLTMAGQDVGPSATGRAGGWTRWPRVLVG